MTKGNTDDSPQCGHIIRDSGSGTKRQCRLKAKKNGYCTKHADHPARDVEHPTLRIDQSRADIARSILGVLKDISLDEDVSPSDRIRASTAYLDRTGYGPSATLSAEEAVRIARDVMREGNRDAS